MKLLGRTALITGGGRGIGSGCAIELAREGADVVINDRTRTANTAATIAEIESFGRKCVLVEGDAFVRESCEQIVSRAISELGHLDIFVSNPAFSTRDSFVSYDPTLFQKTIDGTLVGSFHMSQLVARHLVERGRGGKIVFISSIQANIPFAGSAAYNAAKAGLGHMAKTMAVELLASRINVNVIEPGWIDTPGEHEKFGSEAVRVTGPKLPWGRIGTIADIGRAAVFLCSEDADYITGTSLVVDGGYSLFAANWSPLRDEASAS